MRTLSRAVERHRTVLLTAPAGYGKTSLVADFLADVSAPVCWYSIDPEDDDVRSFLRYLVAAIRQQFPDFGDGILNLVNTSSDLTAVLPKLAGSLVSEIQQRVPDWFILVLEDIHWAGDPDVLSLLDLLLRHLPENCFVILTSRTRPRLGALARLGAQRALTKMTVQDLAFTEEEVLALLDASGHTVDPSAAKRLLTESEGWISGIILLSPWLDQPSILSSLDARADRDELFWYLSEQVLERLPERWRDLLTRTAILQDVSIALCETAFGFHDAEEILKQLAESGHFVTELRDGTTFRYHALFRQFLQDHARRDRLPVAAWHCRAAEFYASRGGCAEAVSHYLAGGDSEAAINVLEASAAQLYQQGEWALLSKLVLQIQREAAGIGPVLPLWRARCLVQLGEPDAALALAEAYEHVLEYEGGSMTTALCEITRAAALRSKGDVDGALRAARRSLDRINGCPETPQISLLRAEGHHYVGVSLATAGLYHDALPELQKALALYELLGAGYHLCKVHSVLGVCLYHLGRYTEAIAHYEQAIEGCRRIGNTAALGSALNNLGNLYISAGSFALAQDVLRTALEAARQSDNTRVEAYATQSLGLALAGTSEFEDASRVLREAIDLARRSGEGVLEGRALLDLARVLAHLNSFDESRALIRDARLLIESRPAPYDLGLLHYSQGVIEVLAGDAPAAKDDLIEALQRFAQSGDVRWLERTSLLLAEVAYQLGDLPAATSFLHTLRSTARSDEGPSALRQTAAIAQNVLSYAVEALPEGALFARLLSAARTTTTSTTGAAATGQGQPAKRPIVKALSLGDFCVELNGTVLDESKGLTTKAKELLFYLLTSGRRARREELIETLWPDSEMAKDSSVLRTNVYRLRKVLYDQCIVLQGDSYRIDPTGYFWFDLHYFKELVQRARAHQVSPIERTMLLETAVQLYRGPFLSDLSSEWCQGERYDVEVHFTSAALSLAATYLDNGTPDAALSLCERVLAIDPYNEDAILLQVKADIALGDRPTATLHWRRFERRLVEETGVQPSSDVASQYQRLLRAS